MNRRCDSVYPFIGVIGNDGAWGEMRTFHEELFGLADCRVQHLSQSTAYEKVVEGLGGHGERVDDAAGIIPALERAARSGCARSCECDT